VPLVGASASTRSGRSLLADWSADSKVQVVQESSSLIAWRYT
jgi:hypothetical protein